MQLYVDSRLAGRRWTGRWFPRYEHEALRGEARTCTETDQRVAYGRGALICQLLGVVVANLMEVRCGDLRHRDQQEIFVGLQDPSDLCNSRRPRLLQ